MPLASSAPPSPGLLSLRDGDSLTATYLDASDGKGGHGVPKVAAAQADCVAPAITGVAVTGLTPTAATVTWTTDEAADSRVTYGVAVPPTAHREDLANFVTAHSLQLSGLTACTPYRFSVASADRAGNTATDDLGGLFYTLTPPDSGDSSFSKTESPPLPIPDNDPAGASST